MTEYLKKDDVVWLLNYLINKADENQAEFELEGRKDMVMAFKNKKDAYNCAKDMLDTLDVIEKEYVTTI